MKSCLTDADLRRVIYSNVHVGASQGTQNKKKLAASFNFTLRSIFDVLSRNNSKFGDFYIGIASITRKLKKGIQYNGQKKKDKLTHNALQNITQKTKRPSNTNPTKNWE
jgi:cytochrome b